MNNTEPSRWTLWLSFPLAVILAIASCGGLFLPSMYADESRRQAALSIGNDAGNLALIVPVLVIAAILALRGVRLSQSCCCGAGHWALFSAPLC
jgi:Na+/H+ antiporter NhaC